MEILETFPRVFCFPKSRINENGCNVRTDCKGALGISCLRGEYRNPIISNFFVEVNYVKCSIYLASVELYIIMKAYKLSRTLIVPRLPRFELRALLDNTIKLRGSVLFL